MQNFNSGVFSIVDKTHTPFMTIEELVPSNFLVENDEVISISVYLCKRHTGSMVTGMFYESNPILFPK